MTNTKSTRIESLDILRGLVMIIMALDHVRDYFHYGSFFVDPMDLESTTPLLFFTRFITHYCAPVFVFLAGTSAFLYGSKKSKPELFKFLFTRGIWLIVLEIVVNNFIWTFDTAYSMKVFQVIWAIGLSMVFLSFFIYLPKKILFALGIILVAGHNLLDGITMQGNSFTAIVWYILHQDQFLVYGANNAVMFHYPVIPWIGVIILGYCFGHFYQKDFNLQIRKKWLLRIGLGATVLFFLLRGINLYGDLVPWEVQKDFTTTVYSFFKVTKYPPSLAFLLITIGPALLFLYFIEHVKNRATNFLLVFGRVPLFYYFLHILVIHIVAIIGILLFGGNWQDMVLTAQGFMNASLINYGYSLFVVYLVWIGIVLALYPLCNSYMHYKANNRNKWWLSYL